MTSAPPAIVLHPLSLADPHGSLFTCDGELYRGINFEYADFYRDIFSRGIFKRLIEKELIIDTEISSLKLTDYAFCLKHQRLPFVTYPFEWSSEMLRDAALLTLDLSLELMKNNLTLKDAHGWNIIWDGPKPKFVDIGSIVPITKNGYLPKNEFQSHFLFPLHFMASGQSRIARWLLHDRDAILPQEYSLLNPLPKYNRFMTEISGKINHFLTKTPLKYVKPILRNYRTRYLEKENGLKKIELEINSLNKRILEFQFSTNPTEWSEYYGPSANKQLKEDKWTEKNQVVLDILSSIKPKSVLDIGSNRGRYSLLAAKTGARVVAFDTDDLSINNLYHDAKQLALPIHSLVMSFTHPSCGYGINHQLTPPASERLKVELVLALALVHHLVFKYHLDFEKIVKGFSAFSERSLLVEFIPGEDIFVKDWIKSHHHWYRLDNFIDTLKRYYKEILVFPSHPKPRVLILCKR